MRWALIGLLLFPTLALSDCYIPQQYTYKKQQVYYQQPQKVVYSPDYYFSVNDYYRDKILLDAFKENMRQLIQEQMQLQQRQQSQLQAPQQGDPLQGIINDACVQCHGANKQSGGLSMVDERGTMARFNEGLRWKIYGKVASGDMPPKSSGKTLTESAKRLFYNWANTKEGNDEASAISADVDRNN